MELVSQLIKKKAALYLELAADLGNVDSMYEFAKMLENGDGIPADYKKAEYYYRIASFYGNDKAMTNLGLLLIGGKIQVNIKDSEKFLKMAANLGNDKAMTNYGKLLCKEALIGQCDEERATKNFKIASKFFKNAADMGNEEALSKYTLFFSKGTFQTENMDEACEYLNIELKDSINRLSSNISNRHKNESIEDKVATNDKSINNVKLNTYQSYIDNTISINLLNLSPVDCRILFKLHDMVRVHSSPNFNDISRNDLINFREKMS